MPQFAGLRNERTLLYSPVAIRLIVTFTLGEPLGSTKPILQQEVATDDWRDTDAVSFRNGDNVLSYPGLGKSASLDRPPVNHRVLILSDYYETYVPSAREEFLVHLYNHDNTLQNSQYAQKVRKIFLRPNSRYPYESHVPLIRGRVLLADENGLPVAAAAIEHQSREVFSNSAGEFTLPVRFPAGDSHTTANSQLNQIIVDNARGYNQAVLSIEGVDDATYRVAEIIWLLPTNDEATLLLEPETGDDLLPGVTAGKRVSLLTFALHVETQTPSEHVFDVSPTSAFQEFQTIAIASTP